MGTYTVLQFVFYLLTIFLLIFKRVLYVKYDKVELVKAFLGIELDLFQAIAGIRPMSQQPLSESALELQQPSTWGELKTTKHTTVYFDNNSSGGSNAAKGGIGPAPQNHVVNV